MQRLERSGSSIHSLIKLSRCSLKSCWKEVDGRLLITLSFTCQPPRRMFRSISGKPLHQRQHTRPVSDPVLSTDFSPHLPNAFVLGGTSYDISGGWAREGAGRHRIACEGWALTEKRMSQCKEEKDRSEEKASQASLAWTIMTQLFLECNLQGNKWHLSVFSC